MIEVVGAAIVRDGRVLAARRAAPHRYAGRWEFPGGKIEPGEDAATAVVRECDEELGVRIVVGRQLAEADGDGIRLLLLAAGLEAGEPRPLEDHDALRWLGAAELDGLDWLPVDAEVLPAVAHHLRESGTDGIL